MSEDAGAATDAGTAEVGDGEAATATDAEDSEAAGLLGGMLANDPEALAQELARIKTESRKWEKRAKGNAEAADQLKKIQDANKTDLERAQQAQREAEEARDEALAMHSRVMAAATHNLPVDLIDYLGTGTEDEIMERAQGIGQAIEAEVQRRVDEALRTGNQTRNGFAPAARPVESMRPGSAPATGVTPNTPDDWLRAMIGRERG
jgi:hypothetical protein